jgi:hypothetical protein
VVNGGGGALCFAAFLEVKRMKTMSIDIETYSDVNLAKCGVYKYAESPDFEILLFGYAVDGGPVRVIDLAQGETIPEEILEALTDDSITKWAFNANFERVCLSRYITDLGRSLDPFHDRHPLSQDCARFLNPAGWKCSMVWSAYMGLPLSLEGVGAVLNLDNQKMKEGRDLIRYFCVPCKETKTNGGRTRNLPNHAPDKWNLFKSYNKRDVEVEMAIQERLQKYPVPEQVWEEYHQDQEINDRGIAIDLELARQAVAMDAKSRESLMEALKEKTGLENPNSVLQMLGWLEAHGLKTDSLGKKQVKKLLKTAQEPLRSVLQLRQKLAKSSVKKYQAMEMTACQDGRARGMYQFYGANRTGRFCLTGDHEVLTDTGWKRLDSWTGGRIAVWNANSSAVSFQAAKQVSFDYSGQMYTYTDVRIDQCSTPDHKMRVKPRMDKPWTDMTVEEMASCHPTIPLNGYRYYRGCANSAWLRVLIMTQADGFYTADGSIRFHFRKKRKIERCKMLLRKAEIPFTQSGVYKSGTSVISIPARAVPLWLRQFRSKTFGFWLFEENPDIFFDELPNWDGYYPAPNSIQYTTCNKQNADIVQALAHMSGRTCNMRVKKHSKLHENWKDAYVLDIWLNSSGTHEIRNKPTISDFTGKVYCAVTSTGYFLVRRNGKVWITGNSGRLIQLQNLPQNHLPDLSEARDLVRQGNYEALELLYDSVPDVLSQLIRTAFVPREGMKFVVSDFSAIEARVISWMAGEKWKSAAFAAGKDIYCSTASQMFGVPVVKHGVNGELRQKGKIAELACIAEGQLVLTDHGLIPIENVTTEDRVWDGENWVHHDGVVYRGEREVMRYAGLLATPEHLVYVEEKEEPILFRAAAENGYHLRRLRSTIVIRYGNPPARARAYDILNAGPHHRFTVSDCLVHNCGYGGSVGALKAMGAMDMGITEEELGPLVQSWRAANPHIVDFWWQVDGAVKTAIKKRIPVRVNNLLFFCKSGMLFIELPSGRRLSYVKPRIGENKFGGESVTYEGIGATKKWERLESYGPKFVENIVQGTARDILCYAMQTLRHCAIVGHVHDELIIECSKEVSVDAICQQMGRTPPWAEGLILRADGYECEFYQKD